MDYKEITKQYSKDTYDFHRLPEDIFWQLSDSILPVENHFNNLSEHMRRSILMRGFN